MTLHVTRKMTFALLLSAGIGLSACSSDQVIGNTVDVAASGTELVARGAVGAGKLAYKGGKSIVTGGE
ncbi:hypothetical protein [Celeribacter sp. PS-C1]|uniref:hypothetical protein n=1 Tax=Celeribacter sp. PS-C1 TaxID=2820813 RepID=UPI001CA52419|nr:hypothetical protein [Celeribacter sp. PS-C1]MBW6419743.1 hypothetical protein [Celeribacter sp. PS-C1]